MLIWSRWKINRLKPRVFWGTSSGFHRLNDTAITFQTPVLRPKYLKTLKKSCKQLPTQQMHQIVKSLFVGEARFNRWKRGVLSFFQILIYAKITPIFVFWKHIFILKHFQTLFFEILDFFSKTTRKFEKVESLRPCLSFVMTIEPRRLEARNLMLLKASVTESRSLVKLTRLARRLDPILWFNMFFSSKNLIISVD